jgi:hypothetical protein
MNQDRTAFPLDGLTAELPDGTGLPEHAESLAPSASGMELSSTSAITKLMEALKWAFSFPAMLGAFLVGRVFYEGRGFVVDPDVWWHIKVGQDILRTHLFPTTDPYSFTAAGTPWIAYEWLGEIVLALVHRSGGVVGMGIFLIFLGSVIILSLYWLATVRSGNSKAGFVSALFLASLAFASFTLRPQMFGYLFLILTLLVLEKFRHGNSWPLWTLPVIFLAWVNTHGSFIIGIGVVALYLCAGLVSFQKGSVQAIAWTRKQRLQLETALLLCLVVLPITPYGTQLAVYPFDMAFSQPINVANVNEWRPMPFELVGGKIFLGLVVIFFLLQMFFRFSWRLEELLLVAGGTAMACLHVRFILLFVPFCAPVFATMLARWIPEYQRHKDKYIANAVLMVGVIAAMIHYFPTKATLDKKVAETYPVAALEYLRTHPIPGKMLNFYAFGGYLVFSGQPVFIDGRGDLYERSGVFSDYIHLNEFERGSLAVLRNYGINACILGTKQSLASVLSVAPEWRRVYSDDTSIIFVRQTATQ